MESIVTAGCDGVVLDENATKTDADIVDTIGATLSALGGDSGEDAKMKPAAMDKKFILDEFDDTANTVYERHGEQGERLLNKERTLDDIVNFLETSARLEEINSPRTAKDWMIVLDCHRRRVQRREIFRNQCRLGDKFLQGIYRRRTKLRC